MAMQPGATRMPGSSIGIGIQWPHTIVLVSIAHAIWPGLTGCRGDAIHTTGGLR